MTLTELLARFRELDAKATPGPWETKRNHDIYKVVIIDGKQCYTTLELEPVDADLIVLTRNNFAHVCRALEKAVEGFNQLKALKPDRMGDHWTNEALLTSRTKCCYLNSPNPTNP